MSKFVDWTIVGPALLAGLIVLSTHVPLGQEVLKRGIIFIDLAIAQIAGLGVLLAGVMHWEDNVWAVQASAVSANPLVRDYLLELQRQLGRSKEVVFEGRDTGTIIFPEADVKFYLDASP